jgi:hypothetical protein
MGLKMADETRVQIALSTAANDFMVMFRGILKVLDSWVGAKLMIEIAKGQPGKGHEAGRALQMFQAVLAHHLEAIKPKLVGPAGSGIASKLDLKFDVLLQNLLSANIRPGFKLVLMESKEAFESWLKMVNELLDMIDKLESSIH